MCVVSNVGDHYGQWPDQWPWRPVQPTIPPNLPDDFGESVRKALEGHEIADLRARIEKLEELLRKAKEYDTKTGQPDCEMDEKVELLKKLAKQLGVELRFPT